jgi:hypothetical protein
MTAAVAHCCEHGKQALHSIKYEELIDYADGEERSPKIDVIDRATHFSLYVLLPRCIISRKGLPLAKVVVTSSWMGKRNILRDAQR